MAILFDYTAFIRPPLRPARHQQIKMGKELTTSARRKADYICEFLKTQSKKLAQKKSGFRDHKTHQRISEHLKRYHTNAAFQTGPGQMTLLKLNSTIGTYLYGIKNHSAQFHEAQHQH